MVARIRDTGPTLPRIRTIGKTLKKVDGETVARALGAKAIGSTGSRRGGPFSLLALSERIGRLIHSSGGRPSLAGRRRRQKIPLSDVEWKRLEELAEKLEQTGVRASPGQVASVLLHEALEQLGARPLSTGRRKRFEPME